MMKKSLIAGTIVFSTCFGWFNPQVLAQDYEDLKVPKAVPARPNTPQPNSGGSSVPTAEAESDGLYLNAVNTDIREIIKQISKVTGKNFLVDPQIRGKVTIVSEKKMTVEEAYQSFLSALEVLGYTVVQAP
ncbi:MAG: hypothetical protein KDK66_08630, partial [Deltaproteobacteria bacterium]|nr:hypothetical protein [Deltaproteobacteria bacterium]